MYISFKTILASHTRKEIFLYGYIYSFLIILSLAFTLDMIVENFKDALVEIIALVVVGSLYIYLHITKKTRIVSILLMWLASFASITIVLFNDFYHNTYFFLFFIPFGYYLVLEKDDVFPNVSIYYVIFISLFFYGYFYSLNRLLFDDVDTLITLFIALLFMIAIGIFVHYTIEESFERLEILNQQKELLLKEVHHRVKNNLNMISSILGLQSDPNDPKLQYLIHRNRNRIDSISIVHEMLYQFDNLESVDFSQYTKKLFFHIMSSSSAKSITLDIHSKNIKLELETMIYLGLMMQELLTNSIKHAFIGINNASINISLLRKFNKLILIYKDNGVGYDQEKATKKASLGMRLITLTSKQLSANISVKSKNGVEYTLEFKHDDK